MMQPERIEIGTVHSVNPARRELRVVAVAGHEYQLKNLTWIRVKPRGEAEARYRVTSVSFTETGAVVTLVPGVLRETVASLKGASVVITPEEYREPPEEELTTADMVGLEVVDATGRVIGSVKDVYPTRGHDVLEIEKADGKSLLVPAIEEVVAHVDWSGKRLVVNDLAPYSVEDED